MSTNNAKDRSNFVSSKRGAKIQNLKAQIERAKVVAAARGGKGTRSRPSSGRSAGNHNAVVLYNPNRSDSKALSVVNRRSRITSDSTPRPGHAPISAPSRFSPFISAAPVAYDARSLKPFIRVTTDARGDSYRAHVLDRLDPVFVDSPDTNVTGQRLLTVPINPELLGERIRRISSTYEFYKFDMIRIHFVSALGTSYGGSVLGFFDSDPVDTFDAGITSLKEAAAHPSAAAHKVWNDFNWTAPRPPPGRFYIDVNASDSASVRQQVQAKFHILLDSAITLPSGDITYPLTLGNLYIEYMVNLSYPTIQPNFVGTYLLTQFYDTEGKGEIRTSQGLACPFNHIEWRTFLSRHMKGPMSIQWQNMVLNPFSAWGMRIPPGSYIIWSGFTIKEGAVETNRVLNHYFFGSSDAYQTPLALSQCDPDVGTLTFPLNLVDNAAAINSRPQTLYSDASETGSIKYRSFATRVVVPSDQIVVWCPGVSGPAGSACFFYYVRLEILATLATDDERATSASDSSLMMEDRLAALERKLKSVDISGLPLESKAESKCAIDYDDGVVVPSSKPLPPPTAIPPVVPPRMPAVMAPPQLVRR